MRGERFVVLVPWSSRGGISQPHFETKVWNTYNVSRESNQAGYARGVIGASRQERPVGQGVLEEKSGNTGKRAESTIIIPLSIGPEDCHYG
jgi:hypothetical protein